MPEDIAILTLVNKAALSEAERQALGDADYSFEPFGNDIQFDSFGRLLVFSGVNKLAQSSLKILLSNLGESAEDLDYGSLLDSYVGEKFSQGLYTNVTNSVADSLKHYNALNMDNDASDEFIETIDNVEVFGDTEDPRKMRIKVSITTESGKSMGLSLPLIKE